jgi:hypothetical protein
MRIAILVLALVCVSLAAAGPEPAATSPPMLTLRVTSATPGQESAFEGTLAYAAPVSEYRRIKGKTPFELKIPDSYRIGAILKADRDDVRLGIQLLDADAKVRASWNSGRIVIMNVDKNTGQTEFAGL